MALLNGILIRAKWLISAAILASCVLTSCETVELSRTPKKSLIQPKSQSVPLIVEHPDGSVTLNSPLPINLIAHLRRCLVEEQWEVIFEQLLSNETKQMYRSRGQDPQAAVEWLGQNRQDVLIVLTRMSNGVNSPDVVWDASGPYIRMKIGSPVRYQMRFTNLDVVRENGQYRLLMIS